LYSDIAASRNTDDRLGLGNQRLDVSVDRFPWFPCSVAKFSAVAALRDALNT
jgi:hypothetical protein